MYYYLLSAIVDLYMFVTTMSLPVLAKLCLLQFLVCVSFPFYVIAKGLSEHVVIEINEMHCMTQYGDILLQASLCPLKKRKYLLSSSDFCASSSSQCSAIPFYPGKNLLFLYILLFHLANIYRKTLCKKIYLVSSVSKCRLGTFISWVSNTLPVIQVMVKPADLSLRPLSK